LDDGPRALENQSKSDSDFTGHPSVENPTFPTLRVPRVKCFAGSIH